MSTDLHEVLARGTVAGSPEPDVGTIWRAGRRRRLRRHIAISLVAVVAVCGLAVGVVSSVATDQGPSPHVAVAPPALTTYHDAKNGLSISYPSSWQVAPTTLTPVLFDPIVPLALGTYPLQPQQGGCDIVPQRALDALGPTDAFIAVYLYRLTASFDSQLPRPAHFTPEDFPPQQIQCTENVQGTVGSFNFLDHGRKSASWSPSAATRLPNAGPRSTRSSTRSSSNPRPARNGARACAAPGCDQNPRSAIGLSKGYTLIVCSAGNSRS